MSDEGLDVFFKRKFGQINKSHGIEQLKGTRKLGYCISGGGPQNQNRKVQVAICMTSGKSKSIKRIADISVLFKTQIIYKIH